jgi:F5/8 type C domain
MPAQHTHPRDYDVRQLALSIPGLHFRVRMTSVLLTLVTLGLCASAAHADQKPAPPAAQTAAPAADQAAAPAAIAACDSSANLLRGATTHMRKVTGWVPRTTDDSLAEEGAFWSSADAVVLAVDAQFEFDMGSVREIKALLLQGDNNDDYLVEGSLDGTSYQPVWTAPATFVGMGLRTRYAVLDRPQQARYLRVTGHGGDNFYSISEFQALCKLPAVFPPPLKLPPKKYGWDSLDNDSMVNVKGVVATLAMLLLIAGSDLRRFRVARIGPPVLRAGLVLLLLLTAAVLCWLATMTDTGVGIARLVLWLRSVRASAPGLYAASGIVGLVAIVFWLFAFDVRRLFEWRIQSLSLRVALVLVLVLAAGLLAWLGRLADTGQGPEEIVKWVKVHASMPGLYYSAGMLFLTALALLCLCLRRQGPRLFDVKLAAIGLFSIFSWWNLGHYHFDHYIHIWEHYHYIVGAKYGPELRYSRLYQCTAVADTLDGLRARVKARKMRRIEIDNELGTGDEILAHPELCTAHFKDPKRWTQFREDIKFFRSRFSTDRWDESQNDHGYNATPVWAILGRLIVDHMDLTWDNIVRVGVIDSVFLIAMWLAVLWAFGWRAAAVAAVYWGCNFPARFYWNGGSFLRYDWQLWMVVGICFLRKNKHVLGGAALTYGALLRIFPGFVIAALVLKALAGMIRERRIFLTRQHQRFAAGCLITIVLLMPAANWAMNGNAWFEFAQNSQKHLKTALTNNMGLKTVMGYDFQTRAIQMRNDKLEDPFQEWKNAKHRLYSTRAPILWALIVLFCVMLARAGDREEDDWVAACLGTGLIVISAELTCYYYGFLMTYGLLWDRRKLPGVLAALLAAFTCFIYDFLSWNDDHFAAMSLASVVVVVAVTAVSAFGKRANADASEPVPARRAPRTEKTRPNSLPPIVAEPR